MELRQLRTFNHVARTLSFTRAASDLDYAQSTVSAQIQALEEELGVRLFDRLGKQVVLTEAGQRLEWYAEKMLDLADEAESVVSADTEEPTGTVTIGAYETLCTYRLPAVLRRFRKRYPQVQLVFRPSPFPDLKGPVSDGSLDVALVLEVPFSAPGLVVEQLVEEPLFIVAPPDHRLVGRSHVTLADLQDESMLLTEAGCAYRVKFERALQEAGVHPVSSLEFNSVEAIKQCVMAGIGLAVLPEVAVATEVAEGRLAPLAWGGPDFNVVTQMVWHEDKWLSPALNAFLEVTREVLTPDAVDVAADVGAPALAHAGV